jgi:hypothetical protein
VTNFMQGPNAVYLLCLELRSLFRHSYPCLIFAAKGKDLPLKVEH